MIGLRDVYFGGCGDEGLAVFRTGFWIGTRYLSVSVSCLVALGGYKVPNLAITLLVIDSWAFIDVVLAVDLMNFVIGCCLEMVDDGVGRKEEL